MGRRKDPHLDRFRDAIEAQINDEVQRATPMGDRFDPGTPGADATEASGQGMTVVYNVYAGTIKFVFGRPILGVEFNVENAQLLADDLLEMIAKIKEARR